VLPGQGNGGIAGLALEGLPLAAQIPILGQGQPLARGSRVLGGVLGQPGASIFQIVVEVISLFCVTHLSNPPPSCAHCRPVNPASRTGRPAPGPDCGPGGSSGGACIPRWRRCRRGSEYTPCRQNRRPCWHRPGP